MKHKSFYIAFIMTLMSLASFAQPLPAQTDSTKQSKIRTEIGLDLSISDFNTNTINAKVMGSRLAGILDYLMENYHQSVYSRKICVILKEQVEPLEKLEFEVLKMQFVGAKKVGGELTLSFSVWLSKNSAKVKQTKLVFHFKDGVSEDQATNEFFSTMSRYVQKRDQLNKQ